MLSSAQQNKKKKQQKLRQDLGRQSNIVKMIVLLFNFIPCFKIKLPQK